MALATRCPHCHTTFRVAHDQLKLRAGLVRCGACKEIFNGIEHLLRSDAPTSSLAPATPAAAAKETFASKSEVSTNVKNESSPGAPSPTEAPQDLPATQPMAPDKTAVPGKASDSIAFVDFSEFLEPTRPLPRRWAHEEDTEPQSQSNSTDVDPLQRMTLMDFTDGDPNADDHTRQSSADIPASDDQNTDIRRNDKEEDETPDPIAQAIDELQRKPQRRTRNGVHLNQAKQAKAAESDEPSFVTHGRRKKQVGRVMQIAMGSASVVLVIGMLAQGIYAFRDQIAVRLPETKPLLTKTCSLLGCRVDLPAQIDAVSIESSELQTLAAAKGTFALTTLLRNRSSTVQAWPNIELTLNDANEAPIARRVFTPQEYLASEQDLAKGFAPASEQPMRLSFELQRLKASGYRVYLFYP